MRNKPTTWTAEAIYNSKKNTIHVIDWSPAVSKKDKELYSYLLGKIGKNYNHLVTVEITIKK